MSRRPTECKPTGVRDDYLYLLGGFAGAIYTLSMVASGQYFSGIALVRASGLIGLTWSMASSAGPAITGALMQRFGSAAMVAVLWVLASLFVVVAASALRSDRTGPPKQTPPAT